MKAKTVTFTSVAVATTKFLFGMCDCTVNSDVSIDELSLLLGTLHVYGHEHVGSQVSLGMS